MLGKRQKYVGYQAFVEAGVNEEIKQFYSKGNIAAVLGDRSFKEGLAEKKHTIKISGQLVQALSSRPSAKEIVIAVAEVFDLPEAAIVRRKSGRQTANLPRKFAMYCCQQLGDMSLKSIADMFGLKHEGSVSPAVRDIQQSLAKGKLIQQLDLVKRALDILKST